MKKFTANYFFWSRFFVIDGWPTSTQRGGFGFLYFYITSLARRKAG